MADSPSRWSLEHSHCCCKIVFSCIPEAQPGEPQPLSMNIQRGELSEENAASTRINHSVESIAPPTLKVCGHRRRHAAWCSECMRASSKHIGDTFGATKGEMLPPFPSVAAGKLMAAWTCCLTSLTLTVGAELMSKMHKYTNRTVLVVYVSICCQTHLKKKGQSLLETGFY